jgi:sugar phosphate isomerase/epimerase
MKRRNFILNSGGLLLTLPSFARASNLPYLNEIGIQLYTLRKPISKDLPATIKEVAKAGYRQVEPYGFPSPQAVEMIKRARQNGMKVNSSHFDWNAVLHPERKGVPSFEKILDLARELELSHLVVPYLAESDRENLDGYRKVAELLNLAAEKATDAKIQLAYHNHAFEFKPMEKSQSGYDILVENFSPQMAFELDVFWVKLGGVDPVRMIKKLAGRVSQLHLKDLKKKSAVPNFGKVSPDTFDEIGDGMIKMEPIMNIAQKTGVQHCHVEQDQSPDPLDSIRKSLNYLKAQ